MQGKNHHITVPGCRSYQVRVKRAGVETSRVFPWVAPGGKRAALLAARQWRDAQLAAASPPCNRAGGIWPRPAAGKRSGERVGVSQTVCHDHRGPVERAYIRFMVHWCDAARRGHGASFSAGRVGRADEPAIRAARRKAEAFRVAYEEAREAGRPFDSRGARRMAERATG